MHASLILEELHRRSKDQSGWGPGTLDGLHHLAASGLKYRWVFGICGFLWHRS